MATLKPLGNYLLVTPFYREQSDAGLVILNDKDRRILMGDDKVFWVVSVGPKVKGIAPRDRVVCKFDEEAIEMLTDGTRRGFIRQDHVLVVLPQSPAVHKSSLP